MKESFSVEAGPEGGGVESGAFCSGNRMEQIWDGSTDSAVPNHVLTGMVNSLSEELVSNILPIPRADTAVIPVSPVSGKCLLRGCTRHCNGPCTTVLGSVRNWTCRFTEALGARVTGAVLTIEAVVKVVTALTAWLAKKS